MPISNPFLTINRTIYQNLAPKRLVSCLTPQIDPNGTALIEAPLGKSFLLFKAATLTPARVRVYSRDVYRINDLSRSLGIAPSGESGLVLEVVTIAANLELDLSPLVWGGNLEDVQSQDIPMTVTNLSNVAQKVQVDFLLITAEF